MKSKAGSAAAGAFRRRFKSPAAAAGAANPFSMNINSIKRSRNARSSGTR